MFFKQESCANVKQHNRWGCVEKTKMRICNQKSDMLIVYGLCSNKTLGLLSGAIKYKCHYQAVIKCPYQGWGWLLDHIAWPVVWDHTILHFGTLFLGDIWSEDLSDVKLGSLISRKDLKLICSLFTVLFEEWQLRVS